jgi:hypothetical protein
VTQLLTDHNTQGGPKYQYKIHTNTQWHTNTIAYRNNDTTLILTINTGVRKERPLSPTLGFVWMGPLKLQSILHINCVIKGTTIHYFLFANDQKNTVRISKYHLQRTAEIL